MAEAHNYFVRGTGFDGPGVLVHNKPTKGAFGKAVDGGKHVHEGFLKQAEDWTPAQRTRTRNNLQKQIEAHEAKIADPAKADEGWANKTPEHREGLLKKWQKEIDTFSDQQQILDGLDRQ